VQHELVKAVCGPMATKQRAVAKAATEAQERLAQGQGQLQGAGDAPAKRGLGRPPKATASLEQLAREVQAARQEFERISAQRAQVAQSLRRIGQAYHFVHLERGVRRNGQLIAADIQAQIDSMRSVAQHEGLSQTCVERIEKAKRGVPKMQATIDFVSGYVRQQVRQLHLTPPVSYARQQGEAHTPLAFNERKNLLVVLDTGRIKGFDPFTSGSRRFAIGRYPAKGVLGGVREQPTMGAHIMGEHGLHAQRIFFLSNRLSREAWRDRVGMRISPVRGDRGLSPW
jgi:hypothetical protein